MVERGNRQVRSHTLRFWHWNGKENGGHTGIMWGEEQTCHGSQWNKRFLTEKKPNLLVWKRRHTQQLECGIKKEDRNQPRNRKRVTDREPVNGEEECGEAITLTSTYRSKETHDFLVNWCREEFHLTNNIRVFQEDLWASSTSGKDEQRELPEAGITRRCNSNNKQISYMK